MNPHTVHLEYTLRTKNDKSIITVKKRTSETETTRVTTLDQKEVFRNFVAEDNFLEAIAHAICDTLHQKRYFRENIDNENQLSFAITQEQGGETIYYGIKEIYPFLLQQDL